MRRAVSWAMLWGIALSWNAGLGQDAQTWKQWVAQGPQALPEILHRLDAATPTQANWLRTAFEAIAEKELASGRKLDPAALETFLVEPGHAPRTRALAYAWLAKSDGKAQDKWLPRLLEDPSVDLRRVAVAYALAALPTEGNRAAGLQAILRSARDKDQVEAIVKELKQAGLEVSLQKHFGFVPSWALLGPFDNAGGKGFTRVYLPEQKLEQHDAVKGKSDKTLQWKQVTTADPYGKVDLNKEIAKEKGAVAYAAAVVKAEKPQPMELRASSPNAVKIWLNGKLLVAHEEYHHGDPMDQYVGKGELTAGENVILVKICQNEQTEDWAQAWHFALRICDAVGTPVPVKIQTPAWEKKEGKND